MLLQPCQLVYVDNVAAAASIVVRAMGNSLGEGLLPSEFPVKQDSFHVLQRIKKALPAAAGQQAFGSESCSKCLSVCTLCSLHLLP